MGAIFIGPQKGQRYCHGGQVQGLLIAEHHGSISPAMQGLARTNLKPRDGEHNQTEDK